MNTTELIKELSSREGVEYEQVKAGKEIYYNPSKDAYFIVVPPEAMPHKETFKEKKEAVEAEFMAFLMEQVKSGNDAAAGEMLLKLLKG